MAALKSTTNPNRYRRVNRNIGFSGQMETVEVTTSEDGVETKTTIHHPARLVFSWREWLTAADRELNKVQREVWSEEDGDLFEGSAIVMPPATWTPDLTSPEDPIQQWLVALCYLTMQNANPEWVGDV